jgi:spore germination protein YaaH
MSHEVLGFVTSTQVDEAVRWLDLSAISTIAYFSLEADDSGRIARDYGWRVWNSPRMSALIRKAHASGTKVVISLERFSWSPGQTAVSRALLASGNRRLRLAREVAAEVSRRGVDGVNVDFEPIPVGLRTNFTKFVESLRAELDRRGPGYQLTFAITGHHESYDVRALLRRGGADAVYLMGYHYAGTWSTRAGSTAPIGGSRYDVRDTVRRLLRVGRPNQIIVGVPYYGHLWPTVGSGLYAPTRGGGYDVLYHQAAAIARQHGSSLDRVEGVRRVVYRARACASCRTGWYQLYYDDAGTLGRKWAFVKRQRLLGTGIWTVPFEGRPGPLNSALRKAFLIAD